MLIIYSYHLRQIQLQFYHSFSVCDIDKKIIPLCVYLTNILIKSTFVCLFSFFSSLWCYSVYKSTLLLLLLLIIIVITIIINIFVFLINYCYYYNCSLLFLFSMLLYFYSYQVNLTIIVSFVNFLIYTFAFHFSVSASQVFF